MTGYNSHLGDRPFLEKRDIKDGFADSPLRINRMLAKLEHWNEVEIQNRADYLASIAVKIWTFPVFLNMSFDEIYDPQSICRDVTNIGHWGNGDVEIIFESLDQLDDIMFLICQAFEKYAEE